ncbi:MAG: carbonic anhydrase [Candidatus Goldiibacteriota bacterium]
MSESYATVINCIDGKIQIPVISYIIENFGVDYVDNITEPGAVKYLNRDNEDSSTRVKMYSLKKRVEESLNTHGSKLIIITAHAGCVYNPVSKTQQIIQLNEAEETIASWKKKCETAVLWIDENNFINDII